MDRKQKLIACFDFFRMDADGKMHPAYIGIGAPYPADRCWNCDAVCNFSGTEEIRPVCGNDSLQALGLALFVLRTMFLTELDRGTKFFYDEDDVDPLTEETLSHMFPQS